MSLIIILIDHHIRLLKYFMQLPFLLNLKGSPKPFFEEIHAHYRCIVQETWTMRTKTITF